MEKQSITVPDQSETQSGTALQEEALATYYVCKNGAVVTDPKDCATYNSLPPLNVEGLSKA